MWSVAVLALDGPTPMLTRVMPCPSAQFALSINRRVWAAAGFDTALQALLAKGRIRDLQTIEVQVYGQAAADIDPAHAADLAEVVFLRAA